MFSTALITLREGLEAALIIGILLGYVTKLNQPQLKKHIISGVTFGIVASFLTALFFNLVVGEFEGKNEEIFEGVIMLAATGIITYMLIWMQKQSKHIKESLEEKLNEAISSGKVWGLISLSFFAIYREGVEIVLFMGTIMSNESVITSMIGAILGLSGAIVLSYLLFKTTVSLNISSFFKLTGIILLFVAAGLFAHGIHELQEADIIPVIIEHIYDINGIIDENGLVGSLLKALFGYNGNPSLLEVTAYWLYLIVVGRMFIKNN